MWGKVLGALIGLGAALLLGAPLGWVAAGAVAGLGLGHLLLDRALPHPLLERPPTSAELTDQPLSRATPPAARPRDAEHHALAQVLCPVFIEVARCDGPVVQVEVHVAREFFQHTLGFDPQGLELVRLALKQSLAATPQDLSQLVKLARPEVRPARRLDLVRALYDLAFADGELSRAETDALKTVVQDLNLSPEQLREVTALYFGDGSRQLAVLGLTPGCADEDIRAAFRRLATEFHPDRASTLGPDAANQAAERFRTVKDAYEDLRKIRGF